MNDQLDEAVENSQNRLMIRVVIGISTVIGTIILASGGWLVSEVIESRQFRLSADRYTQQDAAKERLELEKRFSELPPQRTKDQLFRIEEELSTLRSDMVRITTKIERIEKGM